jgi:D-serine deaminase-like pyridoxal phosphate-dependent protein
VKLVASTVAEIENLAPWLLECKQQGKEVNVLYGLPLAPSAVPRLAAIARSLGDGSIGVFVDHPAHVKLLDELEDAAWPGKIPVWVNIDVGYHREGVAADSKQLADIAYALSASNNATLGGMYTHMGHSYSVSSPDEALEFMAKEIEGLEEGAISFLKCAGAQASNDPNAAKVVLSLGATPTARSIQNLLDETEGAKKYRATIEKINQSFAVEIHAGVYPVLDMQQMATQAAPSGPEQASMSYSDIAFRVLVEVASVYPDRSDKPEALVAAGCIVLGREACKSYSGYGVITPWPAKTGQFYDPNGSKTGWVVGKVSQEHGNLTWEGPQENARPLEIGQKLLVWPNHACIAGVNFGWYLIVDSDEEDSDKIQDVWLRWRGW